MSTSKLNPVEITRKIRETSTKKGMNGPFIALVYYKEYVEAVWIGEDYTHKTRHSCWVHLMETIRCPGLYPIKTEGNLRIYSAKWVEGIIVLASSSFGFGLEEVLDESIKQLGIGIE